jgi:hypothetical protein
MGNFRIRRQRSTEPEFDRREEPKEKLHSEGDYTLVMVLEKWVYRVKHIHLRDSESRG